MRELIEGFPEQINEALSISAGSTITKTGDIDNVIVCGLGGSGIGGAIVGRLVKDECNVPIQVLSDYNLPAYVGEKTLAIISSYSGNTEETISALTQAIDRNCQIACVTSGGAIMDLANQYNLDCISIPPGNPPRAMFAYSSIQLLHILNAYELIGDEFKAQLSSASENLKNNQKDISDRALEIAKAFVGRIPVIYSEARLEGVAVRWRQQFNENSKMVCWHNAFPEMNHNELVGWETADNRIAVVMLSDGNEYSRNKTRQDICKGIFQKNCDTILDATASGSGPIEKVFHLIHLGDWVSLHLAEIRDINPVSIDNINYLKGELAKI